MEPTSTACATSPTRPDPNRVGELRWQCQFPVARRSCESGPVSAGGYRPPRHPTRRPGAGGLQSIRANARQPRARRIPPRLADDADIPWGGKSDRPAIAPDVALRTNLSNPADRLFSENAAERGRYADRRWLGRQRRRPPAGTASLNPARPRAWARNRHRP